MRVPILAATLLSTMITAAAATADPGPAVGPYPPPFVARAVWTRWNQLSSLQVFPTPAGRAASRELGSPTPAFDEAWAEVLALAPNADTPGMRQQFRCHWDFAETAQPGKVSWNLEPWRPVVDDAAMVNAGCNPGGGGGQF